MSRASELKDLEQVKSNWFGFSVVAVIATLSCLGGVFWSMTKDVLDLELAMLLSGGFVLGVLASLWLIRQYQQAKKALGE
ncbi:hypothetical protein H6761_01620 [Candidatus Nomurabacteria bacterium]|nr:hypothetical protein [Candidatus Nomurabacteria bacterium]